MGINTLRHYWWSWRAWRGRGIQRAWRPVRARRIQRGPQAATYWRRRFVALVIGLTVLALVSWAFSGALGGGGGPASGSAASTASGRAGSHDSPTGARSGSAPAQHRAPTAAGKPRPCPRGEVVLSLFSSQQSFGAGELPQFNVNVVATSRQTCTFNVGAKRVALVIRAGSVRVWSSADCAQAAGTLVSDLQRGVPTVLPISWSRQASSPGCRVPPSRMPTGTYTATVTDGTLRSNAVTFRIS